MGKMDDIPLYNIYFFHIKNIITFDLTHDCSTYYYIYSFQKVFDLNCISLVY